MSLPSLRLPAYLVVVVKDPRCVLEFFLKQLRELHRFLFGLDELGLEPLLEAFCRALVSRGVVLDVVFDFPEREFDVLLVNREQNRSFMLPM